MKKFLSRIKFQLVSAYQYMLCCLVKRMPPTQDEIFNYRVDVANGKIAYSKPSLAEAQRLHHLLGLTIGFDKEGKFWWAEDENGEYMKGNSYEEVALLIAVVYNSDRINNFRPEYETDAESMDPKT